MSARDDVLARIRSALGDAPAAPEAPREYRRSTGQQAGGAAVIARFTDRLADYGARVRTATSDQLGAELATALEGEPSAVVPPGLPASWRTTVESTVADVRVDGEPGPLVPAELDAIAVVVTACRAAIAETGTLVLDGEPDQGRRAITLVPDHHVVVVFAEQVVASVPEALALLDPARPLTLVSGPSATSDIEFQRVQGVHGPRRLDVVIVVDSAAP